MFKNKKLYTVFTGLLPLVLLGILVYIFWGVGPAGIFKSNFPPVEELTMERIELHRGQMIVHVVNGGPEPVTVSQVMVDEAYWQHRITPSRIIPRLGRAKVFLPYPWVEGELHNITLLTKTGLTFSKQVEVAVETPRPSRRYFWTFTLLGAYAGIFPVFLGLLWFPFLRNLHKKWIDFFLSLTMGLLIFLGIDALQEAFETAGQVANAFQGIGLVSAGFLISLLGLQVN